MDAAAPDVRLLKGNATAAPDAARSRVGSIVRSPNRTTPRATDVEARLELRSAEPDASAVVSNRHAAVRIPIRLISGPSGQGLEYVIGAPAGAVNP